MQESLFLLWQRGFPVNFAKFLRTPFLTETSRRLLLKISLFITVMTAFENHVFIPVYPRVENIYPKSTKNKEMMQYSWIFL